MSSSISVSSPSQSTPAATSTSAPSTPARRSIPTDPKELVAFLLKDDKTDKKTKELLKKVAVLSHGAKLIKDQKQASTAQLASKPNLTTSVIAKQPSTKHLTTKPVMVAQPAKPSIPVTIGVVQSVSKPRVVSSVATVPAIKSVESMFGPLKTTSVTIGNTTLPSATQSSIVKTESGLPGLETRLTVPSPPKAEKKKKKLAKDSPSLSATLANTGAVKNTTRKTVGSSNPPHMLTTTTTTGVLQYITSGGSAPLIRVITKAAGSSQSVQPTTAAPTTIITTSDGRLLITGAPQPKVSITQAGINSGKSIPNQSSKGAKLGGVAGDSGITGLLKKSGSTHPTLSKAIVGGAPSLSPRQQQASLKTTPVIHIPRVSSIPVHAPVSASNGSTQPVLNPNTAVSVTKSAIPPPPPPPLATITSTKHITLSEEASVPQPHSGKVIVASNQPLKQLKLETVSSTGQQELDLKHKKAAVVVNNNQKTVLKTVTTTVPPAQTAVPLTGGTTIAQVISQLAPDSFSIPSFPNLVASSKQVGRPMVQQLPLAGALPDTTNTADMVTRDAPPLTGAIDSVSHKVIPEIPPLSTTHWKESSPLKSPVEQIMEEHSYLGSSHSSPPVQPAGQSPWQLQLVHTSSPQQQLQQLSGENILQAQYVPKGPSTNTKDL